MRSIGILLALPLLLLALGLPGCGEDDTPTGVDRDPPAVVSMTPADDQVAVAPDAHIRVIFSEPVMLDSLAPPPLRVESAAGPIAASLDLDSTATMLTLVPIQPLPLGLDCRVVLSAGITDLTGNVRADSMETRFSTGLAFYDIGRLFIANEISRDISVIDAATYLEVEGSPVQLGVAPLRLHADPGTAIVYALYTDYITGYGVLALDARSLAILRDSGPVLPRGLSDLTLAAAHDLLILLSPEDASMLVLDPFTFEPLRQPVDLDRPDAEPVRVTVAERLDYLVVGMNGGGRIGAYRLPSFDPVPGFPTSATDDVTGIVIDQERSYAWVAGNVRYAVVDLLNPERTESFQIPVAGCWYCTPMVWNIALLPHMDRAILMYRRQALTSVVMSTLEIDRESPGDLGLGNQFLTDIVVNPRTGELILLGWGNLDTRIYLADPVELERIERELPTAGDKAVDMELLP